MLGWMGRSEEKDELMRKAELVALNRVEIIYQVHSVRQMQELNSRAFNSTEAGRIGGVSGTYDWDSHVIRYAVHRDYSAEFEEQLGRRVAQFREAQQGASRNRFTVVPE